MKNNIKILISLTFIPALLGGCLPNGAKGNETIEQEVTFESVFTEESKNSAKEKLSKCSTIRETISTSSTDSEGNKTLSERTTDADRSDSNSYYSYATTRSHQDGIQETRGEQLVVKEGNSYYEYIHYFGQSSISRSPMDSDYVLANSPFQHSTYCFEKLSSEKFENLLSSELKETEYESDVTSTLINHGDGYYSINLSGSITYSNAGGYNYLKLDLTEAQIDLNPDLLVALITCKANATLVMSGREMKYTTESRISFTHDVSVTKKTPQDIGYDGSQSN